MIKKDHNSSLGNMGNPVYTAEAGESPEPKRWRMQWAKMVSLYFSLGDRVRLSQEKNIYMGATTVKIVLVDFILH